MNLLTTTWLKTNYFDGAVIDWSSPVEVGLRVYSRTPRFDDALHSAVETYEGIADLDARPEWVALSSGITGTFYVSEATDGGVSYLTLQYYTGSVYDDAKLEEENGWGFSVTAPATAVQEPASAVAIYLVGTYDGVVDPILCITTQGIGEGTVIHDGAKFGQSGQVEPPYILATAFSGTPAQVTGVSAGYLLLLPSLPDWENVHAHHLWLEPQRTNLIANPSFEDFNKFGWRTDKTLTRADGGVGGVERPYCGRVSGSGSSKILESNYFPNAGRWASIRFFVSAAGYSGNTASIRYGLVAFNPSYTETTFYVSSSIQILDGTATSNFYEIRGLVEVPVGVPELCFRIEASDCTQFWIDNVLVDPHEGQYDYFDGNSNDGLPGDFRWMGGTDYANKQFSVWYNNYRNTYRRLMGGWDETDQVYKPGLVDEWSPNGSNIIDHWDAVTSYTPLNWVGDAFYPITDVNGTSVNSITTEVEF